MITAKEAAALYHVDSSTIRRAIYDNRIRHSRVGNVWIVDAEEARELWGQGKDRPGPRRKK